MVVRDLQDNEDATRFGTVRMNEAEGLKSLRKSRWWRTPGTVSTGIYIMRRRLLIDLVEHSQDEGRYDLVSDILIRYKNLKKIYGYKLKNYWSNIATGQLLL